MSPCSNPSRRKPVLHAGLTPQEFQSYYWMKDQLVAFARSLGLATHGYKPELSARIERKLCGLQDLAGPRRVSTARARDSDSPLTRKTRVANYKSDAGTRAFFKQQIGPNFHFTYHLNQYRLRRRNLTYGDLVDEWLAEQKKRRSGKYVAPIAAHGKYNRFIREFFADPANKGQSLQEAAAAWLAVKNKRGGPRYVAKSRRRHSS